MDLKNKSNGESSASIRERITNARMIQRKRFEGQGIYTNSQMNNKLVEKYCILNKRAKSILSDVFEKYNLSARMYFKILKVARTLADLDNSENINEENVMEAICYRTIDKKYW